VLIAGDNPQNQALWRHYVESWRMRCDVVEQLRSRCWRGSTELLAAGERDRCRTVGRTPVRCRHRGEAVEALRSRIAAVVCCLDDAQARRAQGRISEPSCARAWAALGAVVIQKPMKQSNLLDALMTAWSKRCKAEPRAPDAAAPPCGAAPLLRGERRLLLAEDNPVNQRVATVVLEKLGYAVDVVGNGTEAIRRAANGNYAAALMDCQMPETDGFKATEAIRRAEMQTGRRLAIIAMTANALDGDRERCIAAGMDDYIPKPIDAEVLKQVLIRWTSEPAADTPSGGQSQTLGNPPSSVALELAPAIELTRLLDIFGDDRQTIVELFKVFRASIEQTRDALGHELETRGAKIKNLAHEIKGMSANMGAGQLSAIAAQLEDTADDGDWTTIERLGRTIEKEVPRILEFIDAYVQG
jgi:CheY-like chemotaxis protein